MRWVGLFLFCVGVFLIIVGHTEDDVEPKAVGGLILFAVFIWAALSRFLGKGAGASLFGSGSLGVGFVLVAFASIPLASESVTVAMSCAIYACVYVTALLVQMAVSLRTVRASEKRWIQIVQEERQQTGRDPRTGAFL